MAMYLYFPGDRNRVPYPSSTYLDVTGKTLPPLPALKVHDRSLLRNAIEGYEWLRTHNFTNAQGLIVDVRLCLRDDPQKLMIDRASTYLKGKLHATNATIWYTRTIKVGGKVQSLNL
jgi:hypothetical protein